MNVKTDNKWKPFKFSFDLPEGVLQSHFSHLDIEDDFRDGFFRYRGHWYHTSDFMSAEMVPEFAGKWHGYAADSFYSGVLLRISEDGESYKVARFYC